MSDCTIRDLLKSSAFAARKTGDIREGFRPSPAVLAGLILEHEDPELTLSLVGKYLAEAKKQASPLRIVK